REVRRAWALWGGFLRGGSGGRRPSHGAGGAKEHAMDERHPGVLPRQRERRDARENRQRLLAAAKRLFAAQGVDATSMHEIARTAGVGQGTLYRHFADKAELCHALLKE